MVEEREVAVGERPATSSWVRFLVRPTTAARAGLALVSAALFTLCFPPFDLGLVVGWFAIVPLAFAVRGLAARRAAVFGGVFGFASAQLIFGWMYRFQMFHVWHGALLAGYVALYPALFSAYLARWGADRRGLLYVPAAGALVEWLRAHAGFLALPWATFGQTQNRNLAVLQLAAFGGELSIGLLVVAVNVALAQIAVDALEPGSRASKSALERRLPLTVLALAVLAHAIGAARLYRAETGEAIVVGAVQPAIEVGARASGQSEAIMSRLSELSRKAGHDGARLVVWPESSVGILEGDLETKLAVREIVDEIGAPIVLGSSHVEKLARRGGAKGAVPAKPTNAAFVMAPRTTVPAPYKKVRLLPFAEYRPIDLPEWVAPRMFDTERGSRHMTFDAGGVTVEPIICWENMFAEDVHAAATEEPSIIAHLVNDGWFGPTAQPALHNLVSVVRAVEGDRPVVIASNMGRSQIVDARGRVVARAGRFFEPDVVTGTVRMPSGKTLYRRYGDWTWAVPLGALVLALRFAKKRRPRVTE